MVERFHHKMKSAIMCHAGDHWTDSLPIVLLGLRTAYKEDLQASAADLVYGEPLRIPGELVVAVPQDMDSSVFLQQFHSNLNNLRSTPASHHANPGTFIHHDLSTCTDVYLRQDGIRRSLQPPYCGPYPVISRNDKTFTIVIRNKNTTVSADRVKPAYLIQDDSVDCKPSSDSNIPSAPTSNTLLPLPLVSPQASPSSTPPVADQPRTTRSGWTVHFPVRFLT
jgi:cleavage and polyadenylation specificity factor subunit 1